MALKTSLAKSCHVFGSIQSNIKITFWLGQPLSERDQFHSKGHRHLAIKIVDRFVLMHTYKCGQRSIAHIDQSPSTTLSDT